MPMRKRRGEGGRQRGEADARVARGWMDPYGCGHNGTDDAGQRSLNLAKRLGGPGENAERSEHLKSVSERDAFWTR